MPVSSRVIVTSAFCRGASDASRTTPTTVAVSDWMGAAETLSTQDTVPATIAATMRPRRPTVEANHARFVMLATSGV